MSVLLTIATLALASLAAPPEIPRSGPPENQSSDQESITIDFIAAEQLRHASDMENFDFVARDSGYSRGNEASDEIRRQNVYHVVRGKNSTLITTESRSRVITSSASQHDRLAIPGVTKLLITSKYAVRWQDVTAPWARIWLASDWESFATDSTKNEYQMAKHHLYNINPAQICFGMGSEGALWNLLKAEAALASKPHITWHCTFIDEGKHLVRAQRFKPTSSFADLTLDIALSHGAVVEKGEFRPDGIDKKNQSTSFTQNTFISVDGVYLPKSHIVENRENGICIALYRIDFADYARSSGTNPLSLRDLQMPDNTRIMHKRKGGEQLEYVWRDQKLIDERSGEPVLFE